MNINLENEIFELDELHILDPEKLNFSLEGSGFLTLDDGEQVYSKVNLTRLLPFKTKTEYISVSYEDDEEQFHEIGVIRDINELQGEQFEIADNFLKFKYYMPEITRIYSIRDNMRGYIFVKVDTNAGKKTLCIRDWYSNFKLISPTELYVVDADGNKYTCPDIRSLDKKSKNNIDMFV